MGPPRGTEAEKPSPYTQISKRLLKPGGGQTRAVGWAVETQLFSKVYLDPGSFEMLTPSPTSRPKEWGFTQEQSAFSPSLRGCSDERP